MRHIVYNIVMSVTGPSSSDNALAVLPAAVSLAERGSTSRLIANALRAAIVDGSLPPGAPLRQDAIARHFSVSAIPVREALRQLESEGWVNVEMNKGATVAPLSADEAREIYEIRAALESLAIGLAIPAHTPQSLRRADELCKAAAAETEPSLYVARNEAFHTSLYEPAARPQLLAMIGMLHERSERYLRLKFGLPSYKRDSDREHAALLKVVRRGDMESAQSLVSKHLVGTGELLYRVLREDPQAIGAAAAPARKPQG